MNSIGAVLLSGCLMSLAAPAWSRDAPSATATAASPLTTPAKARLARNRILEAATVQAIKENRWADALKFLDAFPQDQRDSPRLRFLRAQVLRKSGSPRRAIDVYQRMLAEDDSLLRVRLELAATFMEIDAEAAAEQNYRLALAGKPPPRIRRFIHARIARLAERRKWRVAVQAALVPDTNVNSATSAEQVEIGGRDFDLDEDAKKRSGIGFTANVGITRFVRLAPHRRLRLSVFGRITENEGREVDDAIVGFSGGPEMRFGKTDVAALLTVGQRWFGGAVFTRTAGGQVIFARTLSEDIRGEATVSLTRIEDEFNAARDAWIIGLDLTPTFYATPRRFWRVIASGRRAEAREDTESYWLGRLGLGVYQALFSGFAVYAEAASGLRLHEERAALFDDRRRDIQLTLSSRLSKRDWTLFGLTPFVAGQHVRNHSTVEINDFSRQRFEDGVTRTF